MTAALSGTHLRYLAAIHEIGKRGKTVSSAEVARVLHVSRPSVTRMLLVMTEKGLTTKERYGKIELTEQGRCVACAVAENTHRVAQLLCDGMGLSSDEALVAAQAAAVALPERFLPER